MIRCSLLLLMPALRWLDPEPAHNLTIQALRLGLVGSDTTADDPILETRLFGRVLPNPIGLAAGFDKNAAAVTALGRLGFGFVEAGTVTPRPQPGNPKPRLFRLTEDRAVINRMGFNNAGLEVFLANLRRVDRAAVAVGANVGINKEGADPERDYPALVNAVSPLADYITINISSPNTPGLRDLQSEAAAGGNSLWHFLAQAGVCEDRAGPFGRGAGGGDLGGRAAKSDRADHFQHHHRPARDPEEPVQRRGGRAFRRAAAGRPPPPCWRGPISCRRGRLMFIGAGGVFTAEDALAKILAGATPVQLYTGFAYGGPALLPS